MATKDENLSLFKATDLNPSKEEQERLRRKQATAKLQDSPAIQAQIKKRNAAQKQLDERKAKNKKKDEWVPIPQDPRLAEGQRKARERYEETRKIQQDKKAAAEKPKDKPKTGGFGSGSAKTRNGQANVSKEQLNKFYDNSKTPLESKEDIEIVRFLEKGMNVKMLELDNVSYAVDYPEDIKKIEEIHPK